MLQPLQLKEVAARYPAEIAELRDFLLKSGLSLDAPNTLNTIASRLPRDRSFHRDLTSYIWVVLDKGNQQLHVSDLLGILALAAAGPHHASEADEDIAHTLLRFVMEAKHALDASSQPKQPQRTPPPVTIPFTKPEPHILHEEEPQQNLSLRNASTFASSEDEPRSRKKPVVWIATAAAIVIIGGLAFWTTHLHNTTQPETSTIPAPPTETAPQTTEPATTQPYTPPTTEAPRTTSHTQAAPQTNRAASPSVQPSQQPASKENQPVIPPRAIPTAPHTSTSPAIVPNSKQAIASVSPAPGINTPAATAPIIKRSTVPSIPTALPADTLSKRIGARTVPTDVYEYGIDAQGKKYPVLKRRSTSTYAQGDETTIAITNIPPPPGTSNNTSAPTPKGIVRAGVEGIMSGYIVYSPAPAYPIDAANAHVQGQVRIRASVDRDGTVANANVISGPPLLRAAALDAVQHWRYNPFTSGGHAVPHIATAVIDFELQ